MLFEIRRTTRPGRVCHLRVSGELDAETGPRLSGSLRRVRREAVHLCLDLSGVTFIDCSGLTALLVELRDGRLQGCELEVAQDASRPVRRLLTMTGVDRLVWPVSVGSGRHPVVLPAQRATSAQTS